MKAETQIKIGRRTAIIMLFLLLIGPPSIVLKMVETKADVGEQVAPKEALFFLGYLYVVVLPLVSLLGAFAWALKRSKQRTAIVLFVMCVLWGIISAIGNGIAGLVIDGIIIVLLLQGILGIRKMQTATITYEVSSSDR